MLESVYYVPIMYHRNYTISQFTHTAETTFANQTDYYSKDCGPVTYELVDYDPLTKIVSTVDPSLTYIDA